MRARFRDLLPNEQGDYEWQCSFCAYFKQSTTSKMGRRIGRWCDMSMDGDLYVWVPMLGQPTDEWGRTPRSWSCVDAGYWDLDSGHSDYRWASVDQNESMSRTGCTVTPGSASGDSSSTAWNVAPGPVLSTGPGQQQRAAMQAPKQPPAAVPSVHTGTPTVPIGLFTERPSGRI